MREARLGRHSAMPPPLFWGIPGPVRHSEGPCRQQSKAFSPGPLARNAGPSTGKMKLYVMFQHYVSVFSRYSKGFTRLALVGLPGGEVGCGLPRWNRRTTARGRIACDKIWFDFLEAKRGPLGFASECVRLLPRVWGRRSRRNSRVMRIVRVLKGAFGRGLSSRSSRERPTCGSPVTMHQHAYLTINQPFRLLTSCCLARDLRMCGDDGWRWGALRALPLAVRTRGAMYSIRRAGYPPGPRSTAAAPAAGAGQRRWHPHVPHHAGRRAQQGWGSSSSSIGSDRATKITKME
jgi:hypothetical protein